MSPRKVTRWRCKRRSGRSRRGRSPLQALVRASLGREAEARADAEEALTLAGERGMGVARIHAVWALGLLELSLERPEEAARLARSAARAAARGRSR